MLAPSSSAFSITQKKAFLPDSHGGSQLGDLQRSYVFKSLAFVQLSGLQ